MNTIQRLALIAIGLGAVVMLLYPPFYMQYANGVASNLGYHFLFDPPYEFIYQSKIVAFVHVPTLLAQLLGLLIIGGSAWFLAGTEPSRRKNSSESGAQSGPTLAGQNVEFNPSRVIRSEMTAKSSGRGNALRMTKRVGVTFLAFLASGVLIALWSEYLPPTSLSGALMAMASVGLLFGAWRWSASFK